LCGTNIQNILWNFAICCIYREKRINYLTYENDYFKGNVLRYEMRNKQHVSTTMAPVQFAESQADYALALRAYYFSYDYLHPTGKHPIHNLTETQSCP
jgi:hypothetical protein